MTTRNRLWPPHSPSFKDCSFCLWIILKDKGNSNNLCTEHYLNKYSEKCLQYHQQNCDVQWTLWHNYVRQKKPSSAPSTHSLQKHNINCNTPHQNMWAPSHSKLKSSYHTLASQQVKRSDVVDAWLQKKNVPLYAHIKNFLTFQPAKFWVRE
jgi:hypothetical protein